VPLDLLARQVERFPAFAQLRPKFGEHFIRRFDSHGLRGQADLDLGAERLARFFPDLGRARPRDASSQLLAQARSSARTGFVRLGGNRIL